MKKVKGAANARTRNSARTSQSTSATPWRLPKKPSKPSHTAQAHILANAGSPRVMRVCYTAGPENSHVAARANTNGGGNVNTNIYLGACADIGGTDIELTNNNDVPVSGTYELIPPDKK